MERLNCDRKTIEKLKKEENLPLRSFPHTNDFVIQMNTYNGKLIGIIKK